MRGRRRLRRAVPIVVSVATLAALVVWTDPRALVEATSPRALRVLVPALLAYGAVTLAIEARCLVRLARPGAAQLSAWTAARIKAASYLVQIVHYALGMGAVTYLLRRRTGVSIASAAGTVLLIASLDLACLLALAAVGVALIGDAAPGLRLGAVGALAVGMVGGLAFLRAPGSLGPLDRVRAWPAFTAAREAPAAALAEVTGLRVVFASTFVLLFAAALDAFDVAVPPGELVVDVVLLLLVSALPIAVAGLGTGQAAFLYLLRGRAAPETLLACSLCLSAGLLLLRAGIGLLFAREYGREALAAAEAAATREDAAG